MSVIDKLITFTDLAEQHANKAADRAREIAQKRGMPEILLKTAEATAIGATCAEAVAGPFRLY